MLALKKMNKIKHKTRAEFILERRFIGLSTTQLFSLDFTN